MSIVSLKQLNSSILQKFENSLMNILLKCFLDHKPLQVKLYHHHMKNYK